MVPALRGALSTGGRSRRLVYNLWNAVSFLTRPLSRQPWAALLRATMWCAKMLPLCSIVPALPTTACGLCCVMYAVCCGP